MYDFDQLDFFKRRSSEKPLSRRDFMRALSLAGAGGVGVAAGLGGIALTRAQRAEAAEKMVADMGKLPHHTLGSQLGGMKVSPVCISSDWNHELFAPALAAGINFVHKAGYWKELPDEFKNLPRESYFTDITVDSTPDHPDDYDKAYAQVTDSLKNNGLKYYDIFRAHFGWRSLDAWKTQTGTYRAFERLKKEGKVKYFGVSQHGDSPGYPRYPEIIEAQIESGLIHSYQVFFSYGYREDVVAIYDKASKSGIGMTAMKIYAHGREKARNDPAMMAAMKAPDMPARALIRNVLLHTKRQDGKPLFQTCVSNLQSMQMFEENVGALCPKVALRDGFDLEIA
jgi:diketogulonate reductase-like aldo/keto reductase